MKFLKRYGLWIVVAVVVSGGAVYGLRPKPIEVEIATVERGLLQVSVDEDGMTRIREKYIVSTPVAGRLQRIELRAADSVKSSDTLLARIEPSVPSILDARTVAEAEAKIKAASAHVDSTKSQVENCRIAKDLAESKYERARKLFTSNTITEELYDQAKAEFDLKTEELQTLNYKKAIANFELEMAKAALLYVKPKKEKEKKLAYFDIISPINGRVLRVFQESATVVTAGTELLEIGDPADLEIVVDVLSTDAVKIKSGDKVLIEQWGGANDLKAVVRVVEPAAFTKISALGVEEQRVNIIIDFDEPVEAISALGDGYRVEAKIVIWEEADTLKIPSSALFRRGKQWAVFTVEENIAKLKIVEIGRRNDHYAEVLSGLEKDQQVVMHPSDKLEDGSKVAKRELQSL